MPATHTATMAAPRPALILPPPAPPAPPAPPPPPATSVWKGQVLDTTGMKCSRAYKVGAPRTYDRAGKHVTHVRKKGIFHADEDSCSSSRGSREAGGS